MNAFNDSSKNILISPTCRVDCSICIQIFHWNISILAFDLLFDLVSIQDCSPWWRGSIRNNLVIEYNGDFMNQGHVISWLRKFPFLLPPLPIIVLENHPKSRIQRCERNELRLHFEWSNDNKKCQKNPFWRVFENLKLTVLLDRSLLICQKLVENAKI